MKSLLPRIHQDLFDFIDHDPDDFRDLIEFWYQANTGPLSAALTAQSGVTLMVNVSSFQSFERLAKKLFLVSDTLVLRDTRRLTKDEEAPRQVLIPIDGYRPGYYEELKADLSGLPLSPFTLGYRPNLFWLAESKILNNGYRAAYAQGWSYNSIPNEFVQWISTTGRDYMKTGQVIYAPFIPPIEWEPKLFENGFNLPDSFNATPTFHEKYDWLTGDQTLALGRLQLPFLDGIDIQTIAKVKEDHRDEFSAFSRTLLSSIGKIKAAFASEDFIREVKYIQKNQIDGAISDVEGTVRKIQTRGTWQKGSVLMGLLGVNLAQYLGAPDATVIAGLVGGGGVAMIAAIISHLKEHGDLKAKSGYFLWKLGR